MTDKQEPIGEIGDYNPDDDQSLWGFTFHRLHDLHRYTLTINVSGVVEAKTLEQAEQLILAHLNDISIAEPWCDKDDLELYHYGTRERDTFRHKLQLAQELVAVRKELKELKEQGNG